MANQITELADIIFRDLESEDISIPTIDFWLRNNIGQLNSRLDTSFEITNNDFSPSLSEEEKDIFKAMYKIYWLNRLIKNNLGAAAYAGEVTQIKEGNRTVIGTNKNDVAKTYVALKKDATQDLNFLIQAYKFNRADPRESKVVEDCDCFYGVDSRYYRGIY